MQINWDVTQCLWQVVIAGLHPRRWAYSATSLGEAKISQTAEQMHIKLLYSPQYIYLPMHQST
jgi:hypothetical protein